MKCLKSINASKKSGTSVILLTILFVIIAVSCSRTGEGGNKKAFAQTVKIARAGGIPISPFAFGNNYFNWLDWNKDGMVGLLGTEDPVRALRLNVLVADNNQ